MDKVDKIANIIRHYTNAKDGHSASYVADLIMEVVSEKVTAKDSLSPLETFLKEHENSLVKCDNSRWMEWMPSLEEWYVFARIIGHRDTEHLYEGTDLKEALKKLGGE